MHVLYSYVCVCLYVHAKRCLGDKPIIIYTTVVTEPDDVTVCEGEEVVFTCELNSNIEDDVQWYGFMKDTSTTELMIPAGNNITLLTHTGNTMNSSLTITNVVKSHTGYYWVGTLSLIVCNVSLTVLASMYVNRFHYEYVDEQNTCSWK